MPTVSFYTLGCKLNFAETSTISKMFQAEGFDIVSHENPSDFFVINTCSVTENADKECKQIIKKALAKNAQVKTIIIGCYAQLKPQEILKIPGVKLVLGAKEKFKITEFIHTFDFEKPAAFYKEIEESYHFNSSFSLGERTRTFLKIQDGCDYTCSYCTIPLARGISRSDTIGSIIDKIHTILQSGVKEIVLTGVNIGDFGYNQIDTNKDNRKKRNENFYQLLQEIEKIEMPFRVRISSIEPNLLTDEIIELASKSRHIQPHFHIPLQSGSNTILAKMQRRYKRELYASRVEKIKQIMPHACIGVDVIVGFPGETDELFNETYQFLQQQDVSYLHVFTYSERTNTTAELMEGKVPINIRKERNNILRTLSQKKQHYFYQTQLGTIRNVLWEDNSKNDNMTGWTDNYIKVSAPHAEQYIGEITMTELKQILPHAFAVESQVLNNQQCATSPIS